MHGENNRAIISTIESDRDVRINEIEIIMLEIINWYSNSTWSSLLVFHSEKVHDR